MAASPKSQKAAAAEEPPRKKDGSLTALLRAIAPVVNFLLRLVLGVTVLRLELSFELLPIAIDLSKLVVGELAPLLFHFA